MRYVTGLLITTLLVVGYAAPALADQTDKTPTYESNYRLSLQYVSPENKRTDIEFIAAGQTFEVSAFEPRLSFKGSIVNSDSKHVVLAYTLNIERRVVTGEFTETTGESSKGKTANPFQTIQRLPSGITSNAKIELGKPIEVLKVGSETVQVAVTKLD